MQEFWSWFVGNINSSVIIASMTAINGMFAYLTVRNSNNNRKQSSKEHQKTAKQNEELAEAIQENTDISKQAFQEANNVNIKLKELGLEIKNQKEEV